MSKRFRYQGIVLTRSLGLTIALVVLFIILNAILWRYLDNSIQYSSSILTFITSSLQFALLPFVFFLFSSYEMAVKLRRTDAMERLSAVQGELQKMYASQILVLLVPAVILSLVLFLWHINAYHLYGMVSAQMLLHSMMAIVLYCLLPVCIAILLGIVLSTIKRAFAYTFIILVTVLASPLPLRYFSGQQLGPLSIASFFDWFHFTIPDADWMPDSVYGIPMEAARWVLILFWLFFLVFMMNIKDQHFFPKKKILLLLLLAAAVFVLGYRFASRHSDSITYKDNRPEGLQNNLRNYYKEKILPETEPASFTVESYDIEMRFQANLIAVVKMTLRNTSDQETLRFTLHHGMQVEKVCDTDGNKLDYSRDIDYLSITTDKTEIVIYYSGNMGKYYSNYQAVYLPGYSAFYPIPGIYHLWDSETNKIKPVIVTENSRFNLSVRSRQRCFSNLEQVSQNMFAGESNSIGVFSGLLSITQKENVRYLESILIQDSSCWTESAFSQAWNEYRDLFELTDDRYLNGRIIVFHPATILGFYASDKCVDDGAIIYFGDLAPKPQTLALELIKQNIIQTSRNQFLYSWFTGRIISLNGGKYNAPGKPDYSELQIFNKNPNNWSEDDWLSMGPRMVLFNQLLSYQEGVLGTKVFLQNIYHYLQDPDPQQDILDFIYYMGEDIDD